jgi:broad specificity phosphatase PhoE
MAETTIVHLLRHGEVHNPNGVLYGRLPGYHLSATGRAMADAAADFFAERIVATVYASPLTRAQETAQPVAGRHGLPIVTDEGLIESGNVLEGTAVSLKRLARNPANWRYLWNPVTPSWGEPYTEHRRLWHNPKSRECALGSVTSFSFSGDELTSVSYAVPARRPVREEDAAQ